MKLKPLWKERPLNNIYDRYRGQGSALGLSKQAMQKIEWIIYYESKASGNAALTCRYFGISRKTFYKWKNLFDPCNFRLLEERSSAPIKRRVREITKTQEERILGLRKQHPEFGKMKIQNLYKRLFQEHISSWKIQRVIEVYKLQRKSKKCNRQFTKNSLSKRRTIRLQKEQRPNFLFAFDSIELQRNGSKRYIVSGIDTVSKVAWARMYIGHTSKTATDLLKRLQAICTRHATNICQDNGSEFEKDFEKLASSLNIPQYYSRVKTPKDNPICERFNRTIKEEFLRLGNWSDDINIFNKRLSKWLMKYNTARPHQSLNYLTPFEYHFTHLT